MYLGYKSWWCTIPLSRLTLCVLGAMYVDFDRSLEANTKRLQKHSMRLRTPSMKAVVPNASQKWNTLFTGISFSASCAFYHLGLNWDAPLMVCTQIYLLRWLEVIYLVTQKKCVALQTSVKILCCRCCCSSWCCAWAPSIFVVPNLAKQGTRGVKWCISMHTTCSLNRRDSSEYFAVNRHISLFFCVCAVHFVMALVTMTGRNIIHRRFVSPRSLITTNCIAFITLWTARSN